MLKKITLIDFWRKVQHADMYYQELMSGAKERQSLICFVNPSVVKSHLCKLPYMENLCKLRK